MPANAYLGLYIDSEGPSGVIKDLPADQTAYFKYLSMYYPYVLKQKPDTFVVQFGGGLSTAVALKSGSEHVTVAEGNPAVLTAFREDKGLRDFTGDVLNNPKVTVIDYDGRLYVAHTKNRYDVIDLSLADSAGLSSPGGFADRREIFLHARGDERLHARAEARRHPLGHAVEQGGAAQVGAEALRHDGRGGARRRGETAADIAKDFYVVSSYLSTATVLYKRGGFTPDEIAKLNAHTKAMSFDEIYYPGLKVDESELPQILQDYRDQFFFAGRAGRSDGTREGAQRQAAAGSDAAAAPDAAEGQGRHAADAARAGHRAGPARLALSRQWRLAEGGRRLRLRHPHPDQSPAVLRRLHQGEGPAEVHRPARAGAGRVGLSAAVGDARHRRDVRLHAGAVPADLRLAHHLQPLSRQVRHDDLFPLSGTGLHHRRGGHDLPLHPGALQRHGVGVGADHRHAGVLRPRQLHRRSASSIARAPSCRRSSWRSS